MTVLITFTTIGADAGPFSLYSNANGFCCAFETGVTSAQLLAGFPSDNVPEGTTLIRAVSIGVCTSTFDMVVNSAFCFNFLPVSDDTYLLSTVRNGSNTYVYGAFTGYEETGIPTTSHHLIKLNLNLTIDLSFDINTGFNEILYSGSSIIQQGDGKIIATGTFTSYQGVGANRIIRLNLDGTRDNTFVIGTGFNNFTQIPAIDNAGRIIVTGIFSSYNGVSTPRIVRLLPNGTRDATFVVGTGFNNTTLSVIPNADDSMIISGYFTTYKGVACGNGITKLSNVGSVDPSFVVGSGFSPFSPNNANYLVRVPGDTSIYAAGYFTTYKGVPEGRIMKIDAFGAKDPSFNSGTGFNGPAYVLDVIWGNKLFLLGEFTNYNGILAEGLIVLNLDGSILYAAPTYYSTPFVLGDNIYGREGIECLKLLFTNPNATTTTTTTGVPVTSTTTSSTVGPSTTSTTTTTNPAFNSSINFAYFFPSYPLACTAVFDFTAYTDGLAYYYDAGFTNPIDSAGSYWKFGTTCLITDSYGVAIFSNSCI